MNTYHMGTKCVQGGYTPKWRAETGSDHSVYDIQIQYK